MKLKFFSIIALLGGIVAAGFGTNSMITELQTENFRLNSLPFCCILWGGCLIVTALFCMIFPKTVQKHCSIWTSVVAVAASVTGAYGALFWFGFYLSGMLGDVYYTTAIVSALSFIVCIILIYTYFTIRKTKRSKAGVAIDFFTAVLYLPAWLSVYIVIP